MKKTDYSGLISKKPWSPIPMTLGEAKELAYANEQNKKWLPLPNPGLLERLIGPCAYRSIRDFVRSVPYWKWRPCNRGCFLTCKGHVDAGVSNTQISGGTPSAESDCSAIESKGEKA